ncbi:MAG: hypothetical protein PHS92_00575 [Candidatus Gracilibacteria bacterium]|nr:hypothetical protein [Candidatus Gracilibacteria bacterium]
MRTKKIVSIISAIAFIANGLALSYAEEVTTPKQFSFIAKTNVPVNTEVTSNAISVKGITAPSPITVSGGTVSVNGDIMTSGTVKNSDVVKVKMISSQNYSTTTVATVTIGGVSANFKVTTKRDSRRTIPNSFRFSPKNNVELGTGITSGNITVGGLDVEAPITVSGGTLIINGSAISGNSSTVRTGNKVAVRLISSPEFSTKTRASVTIGTGSGKTSTFTVTTKKDRIISDFLRLKYTAVNGAELDLEYASKLITIPSGVTGMTVTGSGGMIKIYQKGSTTIPSWATSGTVSAGDKIRIKLTTPNTYGTISQAAAVIGEKYNIVFKVKTKIKE